MPNEIIRDSSVDWEEHVYAVGKQLNRWPYSEVVSEFHMRRAMWKPQRAPRVLEVGCGAGNNIWFLAKIGFDAWGIDYSPTAIAAARELLGEYGLSATLSVGDLKQLPYESASFDFVLDRAALTQVLRRHAEISVKEIKRVLAPGGEFLSFDLFGARHPDKLLGEEVEDGSFDFFSSGVFAGVGLTTFYDEESVRSLFSAFRDVRIQRQETYAGSHMISERYRCFGRS